MSLQSHVLYDAQFPFQTYVDGSLLGSFDIGYVAPWYILIAAPARGGNGFLLPSNPVALDVKMAPADDFSFGDFRVDSHIASQFVDGDHQIKISGGPARLFSIGVHVNYPQGAGESPPHPVKITLFWFKDTGLLAQN